MTFKTPLILLLIPVFAGLLIALLRQERPRGLAFPDLQIIPAAAKNLKVRFYRLPFFLRLGVLILFIIALAGPRSVIEEVTRQTEGIDIVLTIDASGSMAAEDFTWMGQRKNRLEVVKKVVGEFIDARTSDRIGLVAFAGRAYTVSPMTTDFNWLKANLERIRLDMMEDGTAIGSAISEALSRLQKSKAKSRVIILLTDGVNNRGTIDPLAAGQAARALGVKVYTIGAGTNGLAPYPVQDPWRRRVYQNLPVEIDEDVLKKIADTTAARYFRATDTDSLRQIYQEIDRMEKSKIEETGYREYHELFGYVLVPALCLLLLAVVLENTVLIRIP